MNSAQRTPRNKFRLGRLRAFLRKYVIGISTTSGKLFDLAIIFVIIFAVGALILESVPAYEKEYGTLLRRIELLAGLVFVLEYFARVWTASHALRYITSFWGIIDLLAALPFVLQVFNLQFLRIFRLLRVFSILKVMGYTKASSSLISSIVESRTKISVFLFGVCVLVLVIAFTMHILEPDKFETIPDAIWWTIVTITTVGYGDIVPDTFLGRVLAAFTMLTAFGIIAVPTGIIAVELRNHDDAEAKLLAVHYLQCHRCGLAEHLTDARYCRRCAAPMETSAGDVEDVAVRVDMESESKPKKKRNKAKNKKKRR